MPSAIWNGAVIAEASDDAVEIGENNVYFPLAAVRAEYLRPSSHQSDCPWKGRASYYSLQVDGKVNENAAWFYPAPFDAASQIKDRVALWRGVEVRR